MFSSLEEMERRWRATPRWKKVWRRTCCRLRTLPSDIKWWFYHRFHPAHRYNIVKTGLRPGYHDFDTRMEAAIIWLFLRFVEVDTQSGWPDYDAEETPHAAEAWAKIKVLHEYFKDYDPRRPPYRPNSKRDPVIKAEFDEKLLEVVRLRDVYWT